MYEQEYKSELTTANFMYRVYGWMTIALSITAITAYYIATFGRQALINNQAVLIGVIIAQLALVIVLSAFIMRLSLPVAIAAFLFYSFLMGITVSFVFQIYTPGSIYMTFIATAGMFGAMSIYGYFTRTDLTAIGSLCLMTLIGVIVAMIINYFLQSALFDYIVSFIGVVLFTLLTAYDTQKLKLLASRLLTDKNTYSKIAILGALTLYLDFINLFMFLLRFTGRQRD